MKKDIVLQVDHNFTYSINTQMKEQLKWLIGIGSIQPGDFCHRLVNWRIS
jgi:hypothetical protein